MGRRVLCLDCDGVIFNTNGIFKQWLEKINFACSERFDEIIQKARNENKHELADMYYKVKRITIDEVLEEVKEMYKDIIPYHEMYTEETVFPGVIELIKKIYETGYYDKIYITTHVNVAREINAKKAFFKKYLPFVEVVTMSFKTDPYDHNKDNYFKNFERPRSNKAAVFGMMTGEDVRDATFVDDSTGVCQEALDLGAEVIYCDGSEGSQLAIFQGILDHILNEKIKKLGELS